MRARKGILPKWDIFSMGYMHSYKVITKYLRRLMLVYLHHLVSWEKRLGADRKYMMLLRWLIPKDLDETRDTPPQVYNGQVYWCCLLASSMAVVIGYDSGFTSGMVSLYSFQSEFGIDVMEPLERSQTLERIISLFQAGALCGTLLIYPLGQLYGRKFSFVVITAVLLLGSVLQLFANSENGLWPMYLGRFLSGIGIGSFSNLGPIYIVELSVPSIRGQLVGFYEIAWQIGGVMGFWINYITSVAIDDSQRIQWLIPCSLQLLPPVLFASQLYTLIESPRWLYSVGLTDEALINLCRLRDLLPDDPYIEYEASTIDREHHEKIRQVGSSLWDPFRCIFKTHQLRIRLLMSMSLFVMQNTLAVNAVNYYSPRIFQTMGVSSLSASLLSTGVFGVIKGICCLIWSMTIVDRYGRRPCLIVGLVVCALCFTYIGFYIKLANPALGKEPHDGADSRLGTGGLFALLVFYVWTVSYGLSWSGTPWVWNSEVFPTNVRTASSALNSCSNWACAYVMARFSEEMIDSLGYATFWVFALGMAISLPVFYLFYPETKGVPVEFMDQLFNYNAPQAHSIVHGYLETHKHDGLDDIPEHLSLLS